MKIKILDRRDKIKVKLIPFNDAGDMNSPSG